MGLIFHANRLGFPDFALLFRTYCGLRSGVGSSDAFSGIRLFAYVSQDHDPEISVSSEHSSQMVVESSRREQGARKRLTEDCV